MQDDGVSNPRCPKICFSDEEFTEFYKPWSKALVVRVLERSFAYPVLKRRLEALWAKDGHIQVSDLSNDYFLVRFSSAEDYQRAAFKGPWKMFDYYITVSCWTPSFNEEEPIGKILTWVRLPKLPIQFFHQIAVNRIGNYIGRTIRMDLATAEGARARYARICVEVDLSKPLLGKYMIGERVFFVEYESLENVCHCCGFYGHKMDACPTLGSSTCSEAEVIPSPPPTEAAGHTGDAGSWMTVTRRHQRKNNGKQIESQKKKQEGADILIQESKFRVLRREDKEKDAKVIAPVAVPSPGKPQDYHVADPISQLEAITEQLFPQAPKSAPSKARPPLADKTNILPQCLDTGKLIHVPVTYSTPNFEYVASMSAMPIENGGGRGNPTHSRVKRAVAKLTKKPEENPKVRSYKTKPASKNPAGPKVDAGGPSASGRPPDGSC
ncbi:hypothetical protein LINPERHAP1_LOCUS25982 [Linum perenne]